ncbi:MAG: HPF/RaiA family ribosome-associated protein [Thermomicrobium sp.]|nr:HPF/RaiA family ribosome-associated protein [Thermomicrobium sp.]MCS7246349.1 HPF/RaiA family ribosome-associated protein [Thermomicrobium sp.]MDW7982400.1 HPF/RaiA family ribosome-associated protein [Thermomicrobium sp.]
MRIRYHDLGVSQDKVNHIVEREMRILERKLADLEDDLKMLDITIEHLQRSDTYVARLHLRLPGPDIAAKGEGQNPAQALRDAFSDLYDALERQLAKIRNEAFIRRARQHPSLARPAGVPPEEAESHETEESTPGSER